MNPFERLGLKPGCDEREIKRAYARELKHCRPDDDPEGFQALNQAYRQCLQWTAQCQAEQAAANDARPAGDGDGDGDDAIETASAAPAPAPATHRPAPHPGARPAETRDAASAPAPAAAARGHDDAPPQPQRFDLQAFLDELLDIAQRRLSADLQRWLRTCEPLYSLELKQALRAPVAHALAQHEPPLSLPAIEIVAEYFDLGALHDPDPRLRHWLAAACDRGERSAAFERILGRYRHAHDRPVDRWLLAELRDRPWWPRRLLFVLTPLLPGRVRELLSQLHQVGPEWLGQRLHRDSVDFWLRVTDRGRLDPRRVAVAAARTVLYYLAGVWLVSALMGFDPAPRQHAARNIAIAFAIWLAAALATIGLRRLQRWLVARLHWDPLSTYAGAILLALALATWRWPVETVLVAFVAGFLLACARRTAAPALLCFFAGICAGAAWLPGPVADTSPAPALVVIAAAAVLPIHDLALARRLGVTAVQIRAGIGKLWRLTLALAAMAIAGVAID